MWAQIAMAAFNVVDGFNSRAGKRNLANAEYELAQGRADRDDKLRESNNELAVATSNLQRIEQSLNNQRVGKAAERNMEEISRNFSSAQDSFTTDKAVNKLQSAQALGSVMSSAAAAGVAGGSVEQLEQVERLRASRVNQAIEENEAGATWAKNTSAAALQDNLVANTNMSAIFTDIDYTAPALVFNNAWQHKDGIGKVGMDAMSGFMGNMNNLGQAGNMSQFGYKPEYNPFVKATGKDNTKSNRLVL